MLREKEEHTMRVASSAFLFFLSCLGCSDTGPIGPSTTTTAPPANQVLSEDLSLGAEPGGGGQGSSTFSVSGPGTLTVQWRGGITPAGGSADFAVTLLRYVNGRPNCEILDGVFCLGVSNIRNQLDARMEYQVAEQGQQSFVVVLRNRGPNGVSGHVTALFDGR